MRARGAHGPTPSIDRRYLTDVDGSSGGTWVVPGSHRDPRNPRGPEDGITVSAPIPGEMQVVASAGSVFVQARGVAGGVQRSSTCIS